MTSAVEMFVISLARASKKGSYHLRGLQRSDRDDVIATALAWCWENRTKYSPTHTLEKWFDMALKDARANCIGGGSKRKKRDAVVTAEQFNEQVSDYLRDPVSSSAEAARTAHDMLRELSLSQRAELYHAVIDGMTLSPHLQRKLAKLRRQIPRKFELIKVLKTAAKQESDTVVHGKAVGIDNALAMLGKPVLHGAECPPCWRCKWHAGYMPIRYTKRETVQDAEVQAAIWATEARKIDIAARIRAGTINFIGAGAQ